MHFFIHVVLTINSKLLALITSSICAKQFSLTATSIYLHGYEEGDIGICGVAHFFMGCCGEKIPSLRCCSDLTSLVVCDICILKSMVFGEKKLSAVFPFP